jgi:hypothetical protein
MADKHGPSLAKLHKELHDLATALKHPDFAQGDEKIQQCRAKGLNLIENIQKQLNDFTKGQADDSCVFECP